MVSKKYQVFVSSTYVDLQKERLSVIDALNKANYITVGMEQFPAAGQDQMDFIKPIIDDSDFYVVLIRGRYGSLADDGKSYTQKEYEYAVSRQIPVLGFLFKDLGKLLVSETDQEPDKQRKLVQFRLMLEKRLVKYWEDRDELSDLVKDSLYQLEKRLAPTIESRLVGYEVMLT